MLSEHKSPDLSRIGEVVEATSISFTVHCYELHLGAPLGALIKTDTPEIFAVVNNVSTSSIDPTRRPVARGQDEKDSDSVYLHNPQLKKLLKTEIHALIVGHKDNNNLHQYLPALPPRIHAFAHHCNIDDLRKFTQKLGFLPLLLEGPPTLADEITSAFLRQAALTHPDPDSFLFTSGQEVAQLLGNDLRRLNSLLRRLK